MKFQFDVLEQEHCYRGFFRLDRYRIRHELFDGGSVEIVREVFERGHAAAVLPYDPVLDRVVFIEQFRIGAIRRRGGPWLLEFVAGIIEPGEDPAQVVRREAVEEAGCEIGTLEPVSEFILSPGGCSEQIYLFCGRVDASRAGGIHGLDHEGEDIRVSAVGFDEAMRFLEAGKIGNATTIIALQWLALNRDALRERWLGES